MDLRKISSLVFSARQSKLPEIVSLLSFNFGLYYQCDKNEKKGSAFLQMWVCKSNQPKTFFFFFNEQSNKLEQGQPEEPKQDCQQCIPKSNATTLFIWHLGKFDGKIIPITSSKQELTTLNSLQNERFIGATERFWSM